MTRKTIVISGINMVEGGIFTILDNCLQKISEYNDNSSLKIYALVNDKSKFNYPNIEYIEFPKSKKRWFNRFYYEYFYFKKLSKKLKSTIWFSLHDMSPNVICERQFLYYHHPTTFYKATLKDWKFDYKIGVFSIFYKWLSQINLKKNHTVFVQQFWIKNAFKKMFNLENILVAQPEFIEEEINPTKIFDDYKIHFFYPTLGRSFKNIELIAEAILLLPNEIKDKIQVHLTIQKNDTKYANYIVKKYPFKEINYLGKLTRKEVFAYYNSMNCLLFPSKLETWGLPITETKGFNKPMLVADLPYAHETVGNYEKVSFFKVNKPEELAQLMSEFVSKTINYTENKYPYENEFQLTNWNAIFDHILK